MQYTLSKEMKRQAEFGGVLLTGKRKTRRPFSRKQAMHVTFRTRSYKLSSNRERIDSLIVSIAKKRRIRLYQRSVNSNHLHMLVQAGHRRSFQDFLRELSTKIVRLCTKARKGISLSESFWAYRPWSRVVSWGRAFRTAKSYVLRNNLESTGRIPYDRSIKTEDILSGVT